MNPPTALLDANVLIALLLMDHVHHDAAERWLESSDTRIATCPVTQGAFIRLLVREGQSAETAKAVVTALFDSPRHEFWPDGISYRDVLMTGVIGHRQVTDAYLAQLARTRSGRLATFDRGLAELHNDIADVVATP